MLQGGFFSIRKICISSQCSKLTVHSAPGAHICMAGRMLLGGVRTFVQSFINPMYWGNSLTRLRVHGLEISAPGWCTKIKLNFEHRQCSKIQGCALHPACTSPAQGARFSDLCAKCVHIFPLNCYCYISGDCMECALEISVFPEGAQNKTLILQF